MIDLELKFYKIKQYCSGKILAYFKNPKDSDDRPSFNLEALQYRVKIKQILNLDFSEENKAIDAINNKQMYSKLKIYRSENEDK